MKGDLVKLAFHEEKAETVKNSAFLKNILEGEKIERWESLEGSGTHGFNQKGK